MATSNYTDIARALRNLESFQGNSMSATRFRQPIGDVVYIITSYNTDIARVYVDGRVEMTTRKYSRTTSRHQGMIKRNIVGTIEYTDAI